MNRQFTRTISGLLVSALLTLAGCGQQATTGSSAATLDLQRRHLQLRTVELAAQFHACERSSTSMLPALRADSRCLKFTVAENPAQPDGRQLELDVMVVPSIRPLPEPDPFVILVGGPGQAATEAGLGLLPIFQRIREERDILLVDQRGTGANSPLDCEFPENDELLQANAELLLQVQKEFLEDCLATIDADPRYYTTDLAVHDLDAIRAWLGYGQLNLWGGSYGTRVALMYLKYFPQNTRSVVLDGVAPPGLLPLEAALDGGRALDRTLALCREEAGCNAAFPELQSHYRELLARYAEPRNLSIDDLNSGSARTVNFSAGTIEGALFSMLYSRESARLIPLTIERLYDGELSVLGSLADASSDAINVLMHYSVICSEDVPRMAAAGNPAADEVFVYQMLVQPRLEGCKVWPAREMPDDYFEPVVSDKPVLIFSASQDPVTPRRWGDLVAETLSNSVHVEARGVGHGVYAYGCTPGLVADFVDAGSASSLDVSCLDELKTRPYFLGVSGSVVHDD
jgi:pimeloyl-ACP methyl ester carboxylesterase